MPTDFSSTDQHEQLKQSISEILLQNGMKKTTMDLVASKLSMSKRTLYEIFESKEEMIRAVINYSHRRHLAVCISIFRNTPNVMVGFYNMLLYQQELMKSASPCFFRDMDSKYSNMRSVYDRQNDRWGENMLHVIELGQQQGVFRRDINYRVLVPMLRIQMESLNRMKEFMPSNVTLTEAFDAVSMSFLRSIASPKGMEILEEKIREHEESKETDVNHEQNN